MIYSSSSEWGICRIRQRYIHLHILMICSSSSEWGICRIRQRYVHLHLNDIFLIICSSSSEWGICRIRQARVQAAQWQWNTELHVESGSFNAKHHQHQQFELHHTSSMPTTYCWISTVVPLKKRGSKRREIPELLLMFKNSGEIQGKTCWRNFLGTLLMIGAT